MVFDASPAAQVVFKTTVVLRGRCPVCASPEGFAAKDFLKQADFFITMAK